MRDDENVYEAKTALKHHIKFFESLLRHLNGSDPVQKGRSMWATWCLDRYMSENLVNDIEHAMKENAIIDE